MHSATALGFSTASIPIAVYYMIVLQVTPKFDSDTIVQAGFPCEGSSSKYATGWFAFVAEWLAPLGHAIGRGFDSHMSHMILFADLLTVNCDS